MIDFTVINRGEEGNKRRQAGVVDSSHRTDVGHKGCSSSEAEVFK